MKLARSLTIAALIFLITVAVVTADDCGCGGGPDSSPGPGDGWDSGDYSSDYSDNSGDTGGSGDDNGSGTSDDSGSDSSSTDSGDSDSSSSDSAGSSGSNGGSAEDGILWRMKGDALFTSGLYNESLSAYEKAIGYDPFSFKSWKGKGQAMLALNRSEEAERAFTQALKLDPTDAGTYALLGDAMNAAGEYQDAADQYLKALSMNPKIEGVSEKFSAVQAVVYSVNATETVTMGSPDMTTTPSDLQAVPMAEDTKTVTVEETTILLPTPTKAGFPGTITGILGFFLSYFSPH